MSTLNENILKVKETFEDIAAAIEEKGVDVGECESPTTYAAKIRSITGTGDGLDPNKLYVEAYDAGLSEPTVEASATDDGGIMLTFGLRRGSDGAAGPAGPAGKDGASGTDGKDGKDGADGKDGKDGKDGADGMDGSVYEYVYFRGVSKEHKPGKPASGVGNNTDDYVPTEKNTVSINGNSVVLKWSDKAQGVDETYKFEWRSERKKSDTNTWGDFTDPILWAKYGEKGKDGDGIQYIFKCTSEYKRPNDKITPDDYLTNTKYQGLESEEYIPTELGWSDDPVDVDATTPYCWVAVRKYRNDKWGAYSTPTLWAKYGKDGQGGDGTDGYRFEFIYKRVANDTVVVEKPSNEQTDFYVPTSEGWTGNPQGVTDDLQVEYICQREKIDGIWQDWSSPSLWAMYGKIGRDGNGVEYIYCLTSSETDTPTLPTMDSTKDESNHNFPLVVEKYSWSDDPQSVNLTMPVCWVSTRKQHYLESGDQTWSSLSTPTIWAKYGKDGKEGGGRTVFIYTGSSVYEPSPKIATPKGGTWNVETNVLTGVTTSDNYTWTMNPPVKSETVKYIWQSVGSFNSSGSLIGQWSEPFCITGEDGRDGTDGVSKEFIYRLLPNKSNFDELKTFLSDPNNKLAKTETGEVPTKNDTIYELSDWTDEPSGIDGETCLIEAVCSRKAVLDENGVFTGWGDWSNPTIWAMWGEDGNDGPGVEYIFRVTGPNATSDELYNEFISHNVFEHTDYQKDGFYPGNEWGIDLDWTDEPQDVDENQPLEWVSIRKGVVDQENGTVVWGEFSKPKIWGRYAEDGYSYKTSYVFTRSNDFPGQPHGGDYQHDYPTVDGTATGERNSIWEDSVPGGDAIIWMSYRTFRSDNNLSVDNDWSTPAKMSDTANFQVEFTAEDLSKKSGYKPAKFTGNEDQWRSNEATRGVVWADDVPGALYMATATCKNGEWNDWVVVKVKGEKGDAGQNGTSVEIKGKFVSVDKLKEEWNKYIANPSAYSGMFKLPLTAGDGYVTEDTGHLWTYDGDGDVFEQAWIDCGKIQGDSAMIYIRFSDNVDGSGMYPEGTVGKYIGIATTSGEVDSTYLSDYHNYKWALWSGDDGFGFEQIFIATTKYEAPRIPNSVETIGHVPTNWSDLPISVSETNPYVWYVTRRTNGDDWSWKGDKDNPGYAALYSRYSYDGEAFHLELTNDQGILPLENGVIDPDFDITSVTTTMVLYAGDQVVYNGVSYKISDTNAAALSGNVVTLKAGAANISEIECTATYNEVDYKKTFHIVKTANAFDIITDKIVLERDPETGNLVKSDKSLTVWPKRWNGQKWSIANGKTLFIKCYHVDGTVDSPESKLIQNSESVSLDLSDEINLSKVRLYFTEKDTENGTEICFEEIGVIANGRNGDPGEPGTPGTPGEPGTPGTPGEPGNGIVSITKEFAVNNSPTDHPASGWGPITNATTSNDNRYLWCKETTTYTKSAPQTIHYIVAVHGEPGASGTGNAAPIIYPAGVWDDEKTYVAESTKVPYVFYAVNNKYYILNNEYLVRAEEDGFEFSGTSYAPGKTYEDEPIWNEIESFEAIYSDIGMFNQALVGKWVFHGDYMFSQQGVGYRASSTIKCTTYDAFSNPSTAISNWISGQYTSSTSKDWFKPNFLVNSKTGDFYASKGVLDNSLLFKSGESESYSDTDWNDIAQGAVDFSQKQQWVLTSTNIYGTAYPINKTGSLPIAQVSVLNLTKPAKLDGAVKFVAGIKSGTLVIPSNTLFQGMTYNGKCYCPSDYTATNCSGGVDGTVTYITPWENPGYDLKVHNYVNETFYTQGDNMSAVNDILYLSYSCPKVTINYDTKTLTLQPTSKQDGENASVRFTAATNKPGLYQCYVNVYFYFNELCVGRYCIQGEYEIYDDSDTH